MKTHHASAARLALRSEQLEDRVLLSTAAELLDPFTVPKFINPLPIPSVLEPTTPGGTDYEVSMSQFDQNLGLGLVDDFGDPVKTTVWGYNGTYPGPTIEATKDEQITVLWKNELVDEHGDPLPHLLPVDTSIHWAAPDGWPSSGVPLVTHLHGGHTESASDGLPEAWFTPEFDQTGPYFVKETYVYDNDQEAATLWYHDHALGVTRLNVYAGLAGFYFVRDTWEQSLNLPNGEYEVPLVIQDRMFTADGRLFYPSEPEGSEESLDDGINDEVPAPSVLPEFFGDVILVNGAAWPVLDVDPTAYRFRMLNGSDSRVYELWLTGGGKMQQIGTDVGFLDAPIGVTKLTLAPGERADLVVDFSALAGQTIIMRNNGKEPFPKGETIDPKTVGQIMAFRVNTDEVPVSGTVPELLRPEPFAVDGDADQTRQLILFEGTDDFGRLQPMLGTATEGAHLWSDPITENPTLNQTEVWEVYNTTPDTHPIHLHLVAFEVLSRQRFMADVDPETGALSDIKLLGQPKPPDANEAGPKDTVRINPGEVVRIKAIFDRAGRYVWHCHILSHEDHEMMRPYEVVDAALAELIADVPGDELQAAPYGSDAFLVGSLNDPFDETATGRSGQQQDLPPWPGAAPNGTSIANRPQVANHPGQLAERILAGTTGPMLRQTANARFGYFEIAPLDNETLTELAINLGATRI